MTRRQHSEEGVVLARGYPTVGATEGGGGDGEGGVWGVKVSDGDYPPGMVCGEGLFVPN